jgi:hypothetical protein
MINFLNFDHKLIHETSIINTFVTTIQFTKVELIIQLIRK